MPQISPLIFTVRYTYSMIMVYSAYKTHLLHIGIMYMLDLYDIMFLIIKALQQLSPQFNIIPPPIIQLFYAGRPTMQLFIALQHKC